MVDRVEDYVLIHGLYVFSTECNLITLCENEPLSYDDATNDNRLGYRNFPSFMAFGAPTASIDPLGEKVSLSAISDGIADRDGTANWWAALDATNMRLLAHGSLVSPESITIGVPWSLASFDIISASGAESDLLLFDFSDPQNSMYVGVVAL